MKIWITVIMVLMFVGIVSANGIRINEIELNPAGSDSGNEWIELYSPFEISLEGYSLMNTDEEEIILNGSFSGYYLVDLESQWLDNSNERVSLVSDEIVHETILFDDSSNNEKTWNFCGLEWNFKESTKGEDNSCFDMCFGDFNSDNRVNGFDLANLISNWGNPDRDLSGNGFVGSEDINLLFSNWGFCEDN